MKINSSTDITYKQSNGFLHHLNFFNISFLSSILVQTFHKQAFLLELESWPYPFLYILTLSELFFLLSFNFSALHTCSHHSQGYNATNIRCFPSLHLLLIFSHLAILHCLFLPVPSSLAFQLLQASMFETISFDIGFPNSNFSFHLSVFSSLVHQLCPLTHPNNELKFI